MIRGIEPEISKENVITFPRIKNKMDASMFDAIPTAIEKTNDFKNEQLKSNKTEYKINKNIGFNINDPKSL